MVKVGGRSGKGGRGGRRGKDGRSKGPQKGRPRTFFPRRKLRCRFCLNKTEEINYLDYQDLGKFITERGKILPSRITGNCAKHQRKLAKAIKRARNASLLPYLEE